MTDSPVDKIVHVLAESAQVNAIALGKGEIIDSGIDHSRIPIVVFRKVRLRMAARGIEVWRNAKTSTTTLMARIGRVCPCGCGEMPAPQKQCASKACSDRVRRAERLSVLYAAGLGTETEAVVAERVGVSRQAVAAMRKKGGVR